MNKQCSICLLNVYFPVSIAKTCPQNNEATATSECSTINKLQLCVPEVNWYIDQIVCNSCLQELDEAYDFKQKCLGSEITITDDVKPKCSLNQDVKQQKRHFLFNNRRTSNVRSQNKKIFQCKCCDESFAYGRELMDHVILKKHFQVHAIQNDAILEQKDQVPQDKNGGVQTKIVYFCDIGHNRLFKSSNALQSHRRSKHIPASCKLCGASFKSGRELRVHFRKVHGEFACEICGKKFPRRRNLNLHLKSHYHLITTWNKCK